LKADQPFLGQLVTMIITWTLLDLACKLFYGLSAQGAARYLRTGKGQSWFNRISAGLFGGAGAAALISH
jgi:threonine/homoserine/homoserine lactone efflux protein